MTNPQHRRDPGAETAVMRAAGRTDVGSTREHNEDAFLLADLASGQWASSAIGDSAAFSGSDGMLLMVADGLGGAAAGEIASRMAIDVVREEMQRVWNEGVPEDAARIADAIRRAVIQANASIHTFAQANAEHKGMGTTATVAVLHGDTLYLAQIGDSRAYVVRNGTAEQITKDQSLMQRLIEAGELTPEEAERSERRNIILQALGPEPIVRVDLTHQRVRRGDRLVLCTDGLSGLVRREEIGEVASSGSSLTQICERLITMANEGGGPDNITVVAAEFEGIAFGDVQPGDRIGHAAFPDEDNESASATSPRRLLEHTPVIPHAAYVDRRHTPRVPIAETPPELTVISEQRTAQSANRALALAVGLTLLAALMLFALRHFRENRDAHPAGEPATAVARLPRS